MLGEITGVGVELKLEVEGEGEVSAGKFISVRDG